MEVKISALFRRLTAVSLLLVGYLALMPAAAHAGGATLYLAPSSKTVTQGSTNRNQFSTANDSCSGRTLARGQACTVSVRFSPTTRGPKTATLGPMT